VLNPSKRNYKRISVDRTNPIRVGEIWNDLEDLAHFAQ